MLTMEHAQFPEMDRSQISPQGPATNVDWALVVCANYAAIGGLFLLTAMVD
jgi:hypothetical protein